MESLAFILGGIVCISLLFIYKNNKKKQLLADPEVQARLLLVEEFLANVNDAKKDYFRYSTKEHLKVNYKQLYNELASSSYKSLRSGTLNEFKHIYNNLDALVKEWNNDFVKKELGDNHALLSNIDGKSLDDQQRLAVVVDEDNNLVLAGAGSGKTLTISAKVKYLVQKKIIKPEEILLISFTRKAAEEMQERISNKMNIGVEAKTFHKLGLDIISQDRTRRPEIFEDLSSVVDKYFREEIINDKLVCNNLVNFLGIYLNIPKDLEEFDNLGEIHNHTKNADIETIKYKIESKTNELKKSRVTIQGETVKSIEEAIIANFLYLNGVKYTYEKLYPFEQVDKYRKQYRPDFYLDEYDIYLEHFGITKDYKVPWLSEIEERKYLEGIEWKRKLHKQNGTILIETYSYYNKTGTLLVELDKLLRSKGVMYKEANYQEIYNKLYNGQNDKHFTEFKKLIQSFIGLYKSKGYSEDSFNLLFQEASRMENRFLRDRTNLFLYLVKPIYSSYQGMLRETGQIDFNDMINLATDIVSKGKSTFKYKYIIIDEYQDISVSRFNLIKEIKNKTNARVVAVGDDWQSIFRFAGSDIDLFTSFDKYLGYSEVLKIENTYRNAQELIDIAGGFIRKNPKQLRKSLKSGKHHSNPIRILGYDASIDIAIRKAIDEIVHLHGKSSEILILGRNNFDIDALEGKEDFEIKKTARTVTIKYQQYPDLKINFLTTHRSKGLEADNVIVINLSNWLVGFPNKIADDPLLSLVLTDLDGFDFAEERRLFYVALTRTRNSVYLISPDNNPSIFIEELKKDFHIRYDNSTCAVSIQDNPTCPVCQNGHLVLRENSSNSSRFLGCSNYPLCDTTLRNIEILGNYIKCNQCGGYMVKREGMYGAFYGCTNYPFCQNTLGIDKHTKSV